MKTFAKTRDLIASSLIVILITGLTMSLSAQSIGSLPRSIPESEGISSSGITDFLNSIDTGRQEIHSFMFIRHGKVVAEGWWNPYGSEYRHIMYSASKTFTATAIGLAISENRLKITDKVISFFPYSLPDSISAYMKDLTVKDLLTMSVGQDPEPRSMGAGGDWITTFISSNPIHKPGTVFKYNNMATFMLSAIVQQVTGETTFNYLQPRIFQPLSIRGIDWDLNPQGINLGMIGLRLHTEDMGKFGQLLLQGGVWNKKQLIPSEWVKEATSFKISNSDPANKLPDNQNDWAQGYCYQMWRGRNNSVRLDGMAGQFVLLFPDKDAVVVLTANARNTQDELNKVYNYLLPAIKSDKAIALNQTAYTDLKKKISSLEIKQPASVLAQTDLEKRVSGREFLMSENSNNIQSVYFAFSDNICTFAIKRDNRISSIKAGMGKWFSNNSPTSALLSLPRGPASKSVDAYYTVAPQTYKAGASYAWTNKGTLEITARFVEETLGSETIVCRITEAGNNVSITIEPKSAAAAPQAAARPGGAPAPNQLRGVMVDIK